MKRRKTALLLAALPWTGFLGVDRFYLGYVGLGLLKFFTGGGLFVLYILDIVKIAKGTMKDRYGRPLA
ncbi:MAG: TM2 domain-containing protein [Clostridia bacterium]|nr:TM2 domain-containing protein [Clostridia bacterium]